MSTTRLATAAWASVLALTVASGSAGAAVSEGEFEQLKAQMMSLMQRVTTLEQENAELRESTARAVSELELTRVPHVAPTRPTDHWSDNISFSGDFRYRYEEIDIAELNVRTRHRLRARAGLVAQLTDTIDVGLRIAAGNEDATSGNTTLGSGGTSKDLFLDEAWATWRPYDGAYLTAGKMQNNFFRPQGSGLLWDSDYTPEGIAVGWAGDRVFVNAAAIGLESDSFRVNNTFYYGAQTGFKLALGEQAALVTGVSYFDIPVQGATVFFGNEGIFFGNSFSCAEGILCRYTNNYEELELFADFTYRGFALPVAVYLDYVENLDVDDNDRGWLAGAKLGKTSGAGSWQLGYQYESVGADAALGMLRDSNVAGGGADVRGHKLFGSFALNPKWHLGLTVFVDNEARRDARGSGIDYDRIILDSSFKF